MDKKLERIFRDRPLSPEEVSRDAEVRRLVQEEFPPVTRSGLSGRLTEALKDAIRTGDKSIDQIAQEAGVSQVVVSRFLSGQRDIHMTTADKLAEALGLKLAAAS
jgi:transcriptional regulator with XRE-family HTH domain